ncbi:hypothetical protein [Stenotrophomonas sp. YAU14A_MKIMI4_1]|uniref:hypothetical protein n=1 Tax=Stenotrophomonas sp. YAU14A_MKIMI4_1 TaxID=2072408 RepID=UPI000D542C6F|nr:hypothetical protein [Stenotrophomonas sp. YAU14A_MKIMI4_1]AWH29587.1 hypothetical protein C1931_12060 [Stenotrophomonas sp. YAU14A_MKIMI4_1]
MSILNVLMRPDQLLVAVDTLAEDAFSGAASAGAKLLLIPQHNLVLATRGSTQFFLRIYELCLQASFRSDFTMEQLMRELGLVIDRLWPDYERAALDAGLPPSLLHTELVLGGWSPASGRFEATAYAKSEGGNPAVVQPLAGGIASPGEPLEGRSDSFELSDVFSAARLQAAWLNKRVGRRVAGGNLLVAILGKGRAEVIDLGELEG